MSGVVLRPATLADAGAVAGVLLASRRRFLPWLPSPRSDDEIRSWVRAHLIPHEHVTVAEADGRLAGFVATHFEDGHTWLTQLFLAPGFTGRGIGTALLAHALEFAERPVRLWAFQQNDGARRFYERHGFTAIRFTDGRDNEERTPDVLFELDRPRADPVALADYSPEWPGMFAAEAALLQEAFLPHAVSVDHVGSTSVPGMAAKPVIDILVGASSTQAIGERMAALRALGYRYVPEFERLLPQRRYFVKPNRRDARFHLHAVEAPGEFWREQLAFRDRLRSDPGLFTDYLALKRRLAARHAEDRDAYTEAKAAFIRAALDSHPAG